MIFKSPSDRDSILDWHRQGLIKDADLHLALKEADSLPSPKQWHEFITQLLLWLGLISLGASLIFFLAFNWQEMSKLSKFTFVQIGIITTTIFYFFKRNDPIKAVAIASLISLQIGALLALSGQTYQTGADPWQLFAIWSLFILPFAIVHGSSTLWLFFSATLSLSISLYFSRFRGIFDFLIDDDLTMVLLLSINGTLALFLNAGYYLKQFWSQNQIAVQILIVFCGFIASWLAIWGIFDFEDKALYLVIYSLLIGFLFYWFYHKDLNLMILAGISVSLVVVSTAFLINTMADAFDGGAFLFISLYIIFCSSMAGIWLRNLHSELKKERADDSAN
ncbi:DUF2157 domain-containing protein [Neptuniibacter caesariensis]|uniref:DUF2157 domain-containing protein n=1 Tax=Neptuniibacter caesariensis TaxID=207954 RepID=A0A7U8C6Z6_NEPCE|nr:DUF2157 domain-containing protein [Neptuniibacter caesariensis]EAR61250.1 hypothetical protein MED92_11004 [Oceanospirillum sp. MED92] [Neptuniibacter caesariensis]